MELISLFKDLNVAFMLTLILTQVFYLIPTGYYYKYYIIMIQKITRRTTFKCKKNIIVTYVLK